MFLWLRFRDTGSIRQGYSPLIAVHCCLSSSLSKRKSVKEHQKRKRDGKMIFQFFRKFCWIIFLVVMVVGGGCVSFYCFWHWRVWDGTGGACACSPRGLHLLQLQSRGSQGHPWTVAHAGNRLHGLGEVVADYPAIFSTTATAGSGPTVTWERRCPHGFIDGLLWDQTETLHPLGFTTGFVAELD